ncbi:MAG: energy-coupling factor transporter transmembrane protein EcfT [Clostridia bacterium]|nr:energy-coupling factor transporter transmembrane protein EcfT [Clostridia bacterium]MEE1023798.1 energy-coupling factor transporter transmembrane component T [Acutalibacteraceae bacterium]
MLNNVTFGQFFPTNSFLHKMDPRFKLILTIAFIVFTFVAGNYLSLAVVGLFTILVMILSKIPVKMYLRSLKSIWFLVLFTAILNMFYVSGDAEPLISFWVISIYLEGILRAVYVAIRIVMLIIISSALTYTTSPTALTDAIESLLKPLTKLHIDIHTFAMMMTIALRFIPTLIEETDKIMSAQKARGADIESGGIVQKIKAIIPILIPLLVSSIRRATELADAMECRCYHGGDGRTRLKVLKSTWRDYVALICGVALLAAIITLNFVYKLF